MKRLGFLIPAAMAGTTLAVFAVVLKLDATATYLLFGLVAALVVGGGIVRDLRVGKRRVVVKVHEAAIAAEQHDGPKAPFPTVEGHGERLATPDPLVIPARRARFQILRLKKLNERVELRVGHLEDPMPNHPA